MKKLICGDALGELKKLDSDSIDVGITSPPYNKKGVRGTIVPNVVYDSSSDDLPEEYYQDMQVKVLDEVYRVLKPGGSFFYNHKLRFVNGATLHPMEWIRRLKLTLRQEIIWNRSIFANPRGWRFYSKDERIYWLYKSKNGAIGDEIGTIHAQLGSVWSMPPAHNSPHPAPFPPALATRVIYSMGLKSGVVLDPYVGSGTTCVVADYLGLGYIGIDCSSSYLESAKRRLLAYSHEKREMDLEMSKHKIFNPYAGKKNFKPLL